MIARDGTGVRKRQRGFAAIPNETVWDEELSVRDLGLLTKLIALPEDWKLETKWLVGKCTEGRDAVMTSLRNLRRLGYYRVERRRRPDGTFVTGVSISDVPVTEWASQHAAQVVAQGTERPKWDISLRLLPDGRVEDEPTRGPVDSTANALSVTGSPVTGPGDVITQKDIQKQTQKEIQTVTPLPTGEGAHADAHTREAHDEHPQLALVTESEKPVKGKRAKRTPAQIPEDWEPSEELWKSTQETTPGIPRSEVSHFISRHRSKGDTFVDFDAAWRTWTHNWVNFGSKGSTLGGSRPGKGRAYRNPVEEPTQESLVAGWAATGTSASSSVRGGW